MISVKHLSQSHVYCVFWQNVGKSMSSSKFVSNLDGMNEEGNFSKDLLKVTDFIFKMQSQFIVGEKDLTLFLSIYIAESLQLHKEWAAAVGCVRALI